MIPKINYEVYKVCIYKADDEKAILNDIIYIPENIEKYRIPHEIASDVELRLRADMLTEEERKQAKQEEKTAYNKGLADAWEAARKLVCEYSITQTREILQNTETSHIHDVFNNHTPAEAISKIKAYEDKQQKIEQEIKVGDEIIEIGEEDDIPGIVTGVFSPFGGTDICYILWADGSTDSMKNTELKKTGRHFPQVEKLLKAAQEE
jgi:hypothetical protein